MTQYGLHLDAPEKFLPSHWRDKAQVLAMRFKEERPPDGATAYRELIEAAHKHDSAATELVAAVCNAEMYLP